jgi:hypothetical protein
MVGVISRIFSVITHGAEGIGVRHDAGVLRRSEQFPGFQDPRRPQAGAGVNASLRVSLVFCRGMSAYGAVVRSSTGCVGSALGAGGSRGVPLSRAVFSIAGQSVQFEAFGGMQYLKDASYDEFGEHKFTSKPDST